MAQSPEQLTEQLTKVTARLEALSKRQRGGGPLSGFKPFLLGALVGGGAALLYAPQAGEQTREFVRRNAGELQESAMQSAQTAKGKIQERTGVAQETIQKTLTQASDKAAQTAPDSTTATATEMPQEQERTVGRPQSA
jgi:gas vesicle protein